MPGLSRSSHALVTGGGRGIGLAVAAALTRAGATVTILGRDRATLDAPSRSARRSRCSGRCRRSGGGRCGDGRGAARQPIDILIANAGAAESAPFGKSDAALFRRMMDVNLMGVVHATQAVLPAMKAPPRPHRCHRFDRRPERLRLCHAPTAPPSMPWSGWCVRWRWKVAKSGVTVNAVCPGFTETDLLGGSIDNIIAKTGRSAIRRSPNCRNTIRKAVWSRPRKSPTPCCGCAAMAPAR